MQTNSVYDPLTACRRSHAADNRIAFSENPMLTMPTPPTDSLYKFIAIAGLITVAGSVIIFYHDAVALFDRKAASEVEVDKLSHELMQLKLKMIEADVNQAAVLKTRLDYVQARFDAKAAVESDLKARKPSPPIDMIVYTGLILTVSGFGLWWWKVQRLNDEILEQELLKLKKINESKT